MTTVQMLLLKNLMEPLLMVKKSKLTVPEVVVVVAVEVNINLLFVFRGKLNLFVALFGLYYAFNTKKHSIS